MTAMSTEQNNNDKSNSKSDAVSAWFTSRWDELKLGSKTAIALVFIVNSMALGLYALDLVNPSSQTLAVLGAISIAFAAIILGTFVHQGVKFQSTNKRKR